MRSGPHPEERGLRECHQHDDVLLRAMAKSNRRNKPASDQTGAQLHAKREDNDQIAAVAIEEKAKQEADAKQWSWWRKKIHWAR